jgi:hypothetical protein
MVTLILLGLAGLMPVPGLIILTVMLGGASLVVALAMLGAGLALIATLTAFADVMGRLLLPSVPGPGAPPPRRNRRPRTAGLQRLAAAVCAGALALPAAAQPATSGSVEPCLQPHGDRDLYHDGLAATGWVDLAEDQRAGGLAMLADAFLPVTGQIGGTWADHMAHRPAARAFWDDLAQNRILMWRDGVVLLLAGFRDDSGDMRVECWTAGPHTDTTDDFFALIGQVWQSEGVTMTQVNLPADANRPATELFISRLSPPVAADPPLTATDGLRTRITFALAQASP